MERVAMNEKIQGLIENIERVIVGKREVTVKIIAAMLCSGHVLIEDVPGVGKTQLVSALAKSVDGKFGRIQLTPDIMPSDITGFSMINPQTKEFEYRQGAAMCNFLLADEINRASPKVQSSLLEVMEEFQISLDGNTYPLPRPFMVLATQNPVETYGTYHLPEAQMDRFIMKVSMGYPSKEEEVLIMNRAEDYAAREEIHAVLSPDEIIALQKEAVTVRVPAAVQNYIVSIVLATRTSEMIKLGASPRGSIALNKAAKALAFINGRSFVTPDDVLELSDCVLSHRLILSPKGKAQYGTASAAIRDIVCRQAVPTI